MANSKEKLDKTESVSDSAAESAWKNPATWPPALHDFVNRCFAEASKQEFNSNQTLQFKNQMKNIIKLAARQNKIDTNDWTKQKLPILNVPGRTKMELYSDISNKSARGKVQQRVSKKRNIFGEAESDSEEETVQKKPNTKLSIQPTVAQIIKPTTKAINLTEGVKRLQKQKIKKIDKDPTTNKTATEPVNKKQKVREDHMSDRDRLNERSKRFERELSFSTSVTKDDEAISTKPIIGENMSLEKKYLRLTSQPKPETVRPLKVLKKTLQLLFDKYFEGATYNYLCDQCKSLRQDLTVQNIQNDFSIMAYEFHSKLAIENGDWGEFNQCQSQLKLLYDMPNLEKPNYYEFLSYRILYYIFTDNENEVYELESSLMRSNKEYTQNEFLNHALNLMKYISTSDCYQLSNSISAILKTNKEEEDALGRKKTQNKRLVTYNPNALLLKHGKYYFFVKFLKSILERENVRTLSSLCNGYKFLPIDLLRRLMCFCTDDEVLTFLSEKKLESFLNETKTTLNASQARFSIDQLKNSTFKKIDIKGQV